MVYITKIFNSFSKEIFLRTFSDELIQPLFLNLKLIFLSSVYLFKKKKGPEQPQGARYLKIQL